MSSNKTTNYQLHSWEPGDDFLRSEFNENFGAIDGALAAEASRAQGQEAALHTAVEDKSKVVTGTYTGDGQESQVISLGFTPKAVLVGGYCGYFNTSDRACAGIAFPGTSLINSGTFSTLTIIEVVSGGFKVFYSSSSSSGSLAPNTNYRGKIFHYLALQ